MNHINPADELRRAMISAIAKSLVDGFHDPNGASSHLSSAAEMYKEIEDKCTSSAETDALDRDIIASVGPQIIDIMYKSRFHDHNDSYHK